MASWVTHLRIADALLLEFPQLHRRGFCVGNIAPDCNVENEDWTSFTPSREVTHWMQGDRKSGADCQAFYRAYIQNQTANAFDEEYAFLLGYYVHLLTDAAFQAFIREPKRVQAAWSRVSRAPEFMEQAAGMEPGWDSIKKLMPKKKWMQDIYGQEGAYLKHNPQSGYLTEILPLQEFPDYLNYLPHGAIVRKIQTMGYIPEDNDERQCLAVSQEEYESFVQDTVELGRCELKVLLHCENLQG